MPTILVICTGNVCRSPLAETILREQCGIEGLTIHSAGTDAISGRSFCEHASEMHGPSTGGGVQRRARILTPDLLDEADLILVAEYEHRGAATLMRPQARRKTFTLIEASEFISAMVADCAQSRPNEGVATEEQFGSIVREMNNMRGAGRLSGRKRTLVGFGQRLLMVFRRRSSGSAPDFEIVDGHWGNAREHFRTLAQVSLASQQVGAGLTALLGRPHQPASV